MPFGPVEQPLDPVALERRVLDRWRRTGLAQKAARLREGAPAWVFYEGPPTANARPGLHHVWPRAFKDLFIRFQTMRGHDVPRKGGWDCHGLPVEIEIEKELGITSKHEIEAHGIEDFNRRCRESVQRYVGDFSALTERAGVSIDTDDAYWTLSNAYIESVWWIVRRLWDEGLLYEGDRVSPYCARCGTALSSHELGQPGAYREVEDPSVYLRFPITDADFDLLVWTTTPWTLISNVAAAVAPDTTYARVRTSGGRDVVLAEPRVGAVMGEGAEVVDRLSGSELVGLRYSRPFELLPLDERGARVVAGAFVTVDDGSGVVHLAPAFGADDMEVAHDQDLPVLNPVGADGSFDDRLPWSGRFVKEVDRDIIDELAERQILVREEAFRHSYPHCWRCGTPLIYWAKTSWFVRTSARKDDLLRENEGIDWHPEHVKHGRFGDWLQNNVDWALSRDRYWGTPLPVWRCGDGHDTCVGSLDELASMVGRDLSGLDLHRPAVDEVRFPCPHPGCEQEARRLEPVLDAWFDSGSMPSAQFHFPFEHEEQFGRLFPADFICEAIDQTRGWFYSLLAVNTLVFGRSPYRHVVCLELVVDRDGAKMSKSKGNVIDPWHIFDRFGADALRWYFFSAGSPWTTRRIYEDGIREAAAGTLIKLWNVLSFFVGYADIDGWTPDREAGGEGEPPSHVLDRWVLARLDETAGEVATALDHFDVVAAADSLVRFVDDLSNWYVRRSRPRFWRSSDAAAHATLHRCLVVTSQLLAPFCPFLADEIWTSLTGEASVHLSDWPTTPSLVDPELIRSMEAARKLVGLGRAARTDAKVKVRQPLRRALLLHPGSRISDEIRHEIADELNVKSLEDVESLAGLMSWTVVPNFRLLGPRLGAKVGEVKGLLLGLDGATARDEMARAGHIVVGGEQLGPDDVEIRATRHEDFALAQDGSWAVALDLEIDDELRREGMAREVIRVLNDLRKECGYELTDRVRIVLEAGPKAAGALKDHAAWIAAEVLADTFSTGAVADGHRVILDGEPLAIEIERLAPR